VHVRWGRYRWIDRSITSTNQPGTTELYANASRRYSQPTLIHFSNGHNGRSQLTTNGDERRQTATNDETMNERLPHSHIRGCPSGSHAHAYRTLPTADCSTSVILGKVHIPVSPLIFTHIITKQNKNADMTMPNGFLFSSVFCLSLSFVLCSSCLLSRLPD
jgi:hypothetical protein